MKVAFLGLGKMGSAIAKLLLRDGVDLTVWNRTIAHAEALRGDGAKLGKTAAEAVAKAEIVFSMVMNDAALDEVMHAGGVLERLDEGAIHVSLSTVSVEFSKKLGEEHTARGQKFVAAPVFGRPHVAEQGKLWVAMGGPQDAVARVRPLVETFSRGITVVSDQAWSAHAMKIGGNFLITAMIGSMTEGLLYAEAMGIQPAVYLETVNKALFQSPFYELYSQLILNPPEQPGGTIALGEKDTRLFREAASAAGVRTPLADIFLANFHRAIEAGMKDRDWAGGYYQLARGLETSGR